jgi:hypothetical protein
VAGCAAQPSPAIRAVSLPPTPTPSPTPPLLLFPACRPARLRPPGRVLLLQGRPRASGQVTGAGMVGTAQQAAAWTSPHWLSLPSRVPATLAMCPLRSLRLQRHSCIFCTRRHHQECTACSEHARACSPPAARLSPDLVVCSPLCVALTHHRAGDRINVNCVLPGAANTPFTTKVLGSKEKVQYILDRIPIKRLAGGCPVLSSPLTFALPTAASQ